MKIKFLLSLAMFTLALSVQAQQGKYLNVNFGMGATKITNNNDYLALNDFSGFQATQTLGEDYIRPFFGVSYTNNYESMFGYTIELNYVGQGQNYSGNLVRNANISHPVTLSPTRTLDQFTVPMEFTSSIDLEYLRLPVMFRFNTGQDDPKAWLGASVYMGLGLGLLTSVSNVTTNYLVPSAFKESNFQEPDGTPNIDLRNSYIRQLDSAESSQRAKYADFNFKELYKNFDITADIGFDVNIRVKPSFFIILGARYTRSITGIERTDYNFPSDFPVEYMFPVSTMKQNRVSNLDYAVRSKTINQYTGIRIGLSYRFKFDKDYKPYDYDETYFGE